jgi:hypothetical protein
MATRRPGLGGVLFRTFGDAMTSTSLSAWCLYAQCREARRPGAFFCLAHEAPGKLALLAETLSAASATPIPPKCAQGHRYALHRGVARCLDCGVYPPPAPSSQTVTHAPFVLFSCEVCGAIEAHRMGDIPKPCGQPKGGGYCGGDLIQNPEPPICAHGRRGGHLCPHCLFVRVPR